MWLQHVQRMGTNKTPKQALRYRLKGRRKIGRPKKRWRDQLHFADQGTGNTPNPLWTWWWWWYPVSSCSLFPTDYVTRAVQTAGESEWERKTHKNRGSRVVKRRIEDRKIIWVTPNSFVQLILSFMMIFRDTASVGVIGPTFPWHDTHQPENISLTKIHTLCLYGNWSDSEPIIWCFSDRAS